MGKMGFHNNKKHPPVSPTTPSVVSNNNSVDSKGMKILSSHKPACECHIREAVLIECHAGPHLMNSNVEYNHCSIPRIKVTIGKEKKVEENVTNEKE